MKIEIESVEDTTRMFDVRFGDKTSGPLTYDEVLGLISALIMPEDRPCIHWLQTEEQHKNNLQVLNEADSIFE